MEAAAWMKNKKVASSLGAAKSLFFILCLLTLISQTSSYGDMLDVAKLRQDVQFLKEQLEAVKVDQKSLSSILELVARPDQWMKRLRDLKDNLPKGNPEITKLVERFVQLAENTDTLVKASKETFKENDKLIKEAAMRIDSLEKKHDEF